MTHTPGPWTARESRTDRVRIWVEGPDVEICSQRRAGYRDEERANARLIAAAPDMLAMLKECADFVQPFNGARGLLDRIEAAIARAESQP